MKEFNSKEVHKKALTSEVSDIDSAKGIVDIAFSSFNNVDSYGDIVRKGAFTKTFKDQFSRIKHVVDHGWDTKDIVGLPIKLWETDKFAMASSQLNMNLDKCRDLFEQYKFFADMGRSLEHSFAYRIIKTQANEDIAGYDITELAMREYSTCAWGANENTPLIGMKSDADTNLTMLFNWLQKDIAPESIEQSKALIATTIESMLRKANLTDAYGQKLEDICSELRKSSDVEPGNHSNNEPTQATGEDFKKLLFLQTI